MAKQFWFSWMVKLLFYISKYERILSYLTFKYTTILFKDKKQIVDFVLNDYHSADISEKLKSLLNIAGKVQQSGKAVSDGDVAKARTHGATDREIHDTVLIAATFSMFNRYVDGLASMTPTDPAAYEAMGQRLGEKGYALPKP